MLTRATESSANLIQVEEITAATALLTTSVGENSESGTASVMVDGEVKICSPGCTDCGDGVCADCSHGYVFDSASTLCYECAENCKTCDVNNQNKCYTCFDGAYLSGNECLPCDA